MDKAGRTAIKLTTKQHDQAMVALYNSLMPEAITDYAKSYMQGNTNTYPTTAEAVARNLTDNYGKIVLPRNAQKSKKKLTN